MSTGDFHEMMMRRALALAASAPGRIAPNPKVGAVIVKAGKVISEGAHHGPGTLHAEAAAIADAKDKTELRGASIYVNLEPCSHFGRTPPCADAIVNAGIGEAFIADGDPNPTVAGAGIRKLREAGIKINLGILREEARDLNRRFLTFHEKKRPYIILKWAQTSDGFIARADGSSKWISSDKSRAVVHGWRAAEAAILVGRGTAVVDDPMLTVRLAPGVNPVRAALDRYLAIPATHRLFDQAAPTIIFNALRADPAANPAFVKLDYEAPIMQQVLDELYRRELTSLIVEGGAKLLKSFIDSGLWDEARIFVSKHRYLDGLSAPSIDAPPFIRTEIGSDELRIHINKNNLFKPLRGEFGE